MSLWSRIILVLLTVTLSACGKSDDQKASDTAYNQVAQYNSLSEDIRLNPPTSSMSIKELDDYEGKVKRFEDLHTSLQAINGTHGITIQETGDPTLLIMYRRQQIASLRAAKTAAADN